VQAEALSFDSDGFNMPTRFSIRITAVAVALGVALAVFAAWRADRRDRAQLAADLATAQQALAQADARQHERDAQLLQTLATLAAEKRTTTTPAQVVRELPREIPLPVPITLQVPDPMTKPQKATCSSGPVCGPEGLDSTAPINSKPSAKPLEPSAVIPAEDLKPLYDFTLDCKACQAKLAAAQADLIDERAKTAVLVRERDEAVRAAKGGSLLRRIARNAKWLAIGAAAGAIAAKAHP
jgi:type II secretory pathway pseudopilin PulG